MAAEDKIDSVRGLASAGTDPANTPPSLEELSKMCGAMRGICNGPELKDCINCES